MSDRQPPSPRPSAPQPGGRSTDATVADRATVEDAVTVDGTTVDRATVEDSTTADGATADGTTVDKATVEDSTTADGTTGKNPADGEPGRAGGRARGDGKPGGAASIDDAAASIDAKATDASSGAGAGAGVTQGAPGGPSGSDPWSAFAPAPEPVPTRIRRVVRAVGRALIHEWTLATVGALVLAVLMTWPTLRYPQHTIPQDIWDPTLQAWQMAWSGHILSTDPGQLWHANVFYPERYSFAFSDTLLGYAPAGLIGSGPVAAVVRYNIMYVLLHGLAFLGAYALLRQLGAGRTGSAVAGAAFAYAPWRLAQAGHMHVLSTGGIALALAMLARGHGWSLRHGHRPERTNAGWAVAGWLVATWQISLGFGIGLPFAYVLALIAAFTVLSWLARRTLFRSARRHRLSRRLLVADLLGGVIFAGVGVLLALPYLRVADLHPEARRTIAELRLFSPPLDGFFTAPAESRLWGGAHEQARAALPFPAEMTLLPGFVLYGLAAAGLFFSVWTVWQRLLLAAGAAASLALAMGTQFFDGDTGYLVLYNNLPGWDGIRTPGRLVVWTTLLLGILAAGTVSAFADRARELAAQRVPYRPGLGLRLATLIPLVLVLAEGLNSTPHPIVPAQPEAFRSVTGPLMVLPSDQLIDENIMLWATDRFPEMVNGGSGFVPMRQGETRRTSQTFPDQNSVTYLRELGVETVLVLRDAVVGTPWEQAPNLPVDGLGITREEIGDAVVFDLNP